MATFTTDLSAKGPLRGLFPRIWEAMMRGAERHMAPRRQAIRNLERKSDAELAVLGLRREDIPHYVFRDLYYA